MGIGLNEEIVNELKQEYLENYEKGINTDVSVFYIDGSPFKSDNLKSRVFSQGLRGDKVEETIDKEARDKMELMAEMTQVIYDRRKAFGRNFFSLDDRKAYKNINNQNVRDYRFVDLESDLTGLFVNDERKEAVLATRGILPTFDRKDTLQTIPMIRDFLFEQEKPESFGSQFKRDRKQVDEMYRRTKIRFPDYKILATGHSRGGAAATYLGRKWDLEFHAFSAVGNQADFIDSVPVVNGHQYYSTKDPVSYHLHKQKGNTVEQHYELYNNKINPHSVKHFYDTDSVVVKHPKLSKAEQMGLDEEVMLDMQQNEEDVISAEDYVLSDLGIFDGFESKRVGKQMTVSSRKKPVIERIEIPKFERKEYFPRNDPKHKDTIAILGDIPTERGIFNEFVDSVYNDLELRPPKPFQPMNFNVLDSDKSGKISFDEFKRYFTKLNYDDETITNLFKTYDVDGDKNIDRQEFDKLVKGL